jgi:hypothetical protein
VPARAQPALARPTNKLDWKLLGVCEVSSAVRFPCATSCRAYRAWSSLASENTTASTAHSGERVSVSVDDPSASRSQTKREARPCGVRVLHKHAFTRNQR